LKRFWRIDVRRFEGWPNPQPLNAKFVDGAFAKRSGPFLRQSLFEAFGRVATKSLRRTGFRIKRTCGGNVIAPTLLELYDPLTFRTLSSGTYSIGTPQFYSWLTSYTGGIRFTREYSTQNVFTSSL
jgi:hypothetical protein